MVSSQQWRQPWFRATCWTLQLLLWGWLLHREHAKEAGQQIELLAGTIIWQEATGIHGAWTRQPCKQRGSLSSPAASSLCTVSVLWYNNSPNARSSKWLNHVSLLFCLQRPKVSPLGSHHTDTLTCPGQLPHTWPYHLRQRWVVGFSIPSKFLILINSQTLGIFLILFAQDQNLCLHSSLTSYRQDRCDGFILGTNVLIQYTVVCSPSVRWCECFCRMLWKIIPLWHFIKTT